MVYKTMTTNEQVDNVISQIVAMVTKGASPSAVADEGARLTQDWDAPALAKYNQACGDTLSAINATKLRPNDFTSLKRHALLLGELKRFEEAVAGFEAALVLRPDASECHFYRGVALIELGRPHEALKAFDRAIALRGDLPLYWLGRANMLLLMGRYKEGWPLFEARRSHPAYVAPAYLAQKPMWNGKPFPGKTLLVYSEGGAGDVIEMYRFMPMLKSFGTVIFQVLPSLVRLFAIQAKHFTVVPIGIPLPAFDLHCSILSLPWLLGIDRDTIPGTPYLHAPVMHTPGLAHIGISWQNIDIEFRTVPLRAMLEMVPPNAAVVSLQTDVTDEDRKTLKSRNVQIPDLRDFAEMAEVIGKLDLVITADTEVAHLSGAVGKPMWVMLPTRTCWTWGLVTSETPWYPTAKLFRQAKPGDWSRVIQKVSEEFNK